MNKPNEYQTTATSTKHNNDKTRNIYDTVTTNLAKNSYKAEMFDRTLQQQQPYRNLVAIPDKSAGSCAEMYFRPTLPILSDKEREQDMSNGKYRSIAVFR